MWKIINSLANGTITRIVYGANQEITGTVTGVARESGTDGAPTGLNVTVFDGVSSTTVYVSGVR